MLTREMIEAATGRELDALVAEHVFPKKWKPNIEWARRDKSIIVNFPAYSTDYNTAFEVVSKMREGIFSQRYKFSDKLHSIVKADSDTIAWPWAVMYLEPHHLCRAALLAVMEGSR